MKKKLLLTGLIVISFFNKKKNKKIKKNNNRKQIGLFGIDFYNETRLADKFALRAEASLFPAIWGGDLYGKTGFAFYPALTLQPKYYYNIARRAEKGKNTKNNGANYLGLQVRYIPNWFVISNTENVSLSNQINFIPTFGIRRNFSENFNYEFKAGLGYGTTFGEKFNNSGAVLDLSIKVGYDF